MALPGFRHLGLKIVSIGLATMLWLVVAGEQIVERALRVPLEFTNVPPELELVGDAPPVVDVRVRGSSGALSRIGPGDLVALLDLRGARSGPRLFHLSGSDVRAPFGVQVVRVTPSSLWITLERSASKVVPVVPELDAGEPAPGFVVGTVTADPPTVEVVGPASQIERLTNAVTEPVSVRGATGDVVEEVNIGTAVASVRLREPQRARVRVEIVPEPVEWTVEHVPVQVRNGKRVTRMVPESVTLHVRGPRELAARDASHFEAFVELDGLAPGQHTAPVRVVPPARVLIVGVEPPDVRVRIE